jgi:arginine-tRNA-protein transferase
MHQKKQWPYICITPSEYQRSYVDGNLNEAREILYVYDDQLIGVALSDILPQAISAIYCYYDHDFDWLSIGRFSILAQIKMAKALNIPYIYLGYWIKQHQSMGYKEEYKPFEILHNRSALNEKAIWLPYEDVSN